MIEEIKKVENGYRITTDKGELFLDFCKMNEIIGFKDDVVFGHGDGNLVSLNIVTDDYELWTPYKENHISYSRLSYVQAYVIFSVKQRMKKKYMSQYLNTSRNVQHVTIYRS